MKYNHNFTLIQDNKTNRIYKDENINVRLDFINHILRVAIYKDNENIVPTFTICPNDTTMKENGRDKLSTKGFDLITPNVENETFTIDDVTIKIDLHNFQMSYYRNNKLLFKDREYISYNFENELGNGARHYISKEKKEQIFGLGDKAGNINKNKNSYKMATSDSMGYDARSSDPLYKQLPFYICRNSVGSYGIYYDTYSNGEINLGKEINNYYSSFKSFSSEEETLVFYVIFGDVKQIVNRFSMLCGKNVFPPLWSFKYNGSTMSYTDADNADEQLRGFVNLCKKYHIDCGGFYLSSGYTQVGTRRYVFNWNKDKVPSPSDLANYFKENGIEFIPNVKPCFLTTHFLYDFIASKGWFLHYKDGTPATFPFWDGMGSYLDFTNPKASKFWSDCIKEKLVDLGYKNIWNDNNEYDISDEEVYAHGFSFPIKAKLIKPLFSYLMTNASLKAQDHSIRTMSVTRSGCGGYQRIATSWTGDNNTSFDDFRYNHKIAMTMSLSGFYNFGQDIGGFAGERPSKELFLRWIQYGIFTPRFTLHSWNPDGIPTMPWLYEDLIPTVQKLFDLRSKLLLYLYNEVYRSTNDYLPIIYPIFLNYEDYDVESDNFFFGNSIIACPIFDENSTLVKVDLPTNNGGWYYDNTKYEGHVEIKNTMLDLPVYFIKAGSVIPYNSKDGVEFTIYPNEQGSFEYTYFEDDGISNLKDNKYTLTTFKVKANKKEVTVYVTSTNHPIKVVDAYNRNVYIKNL